MRNLLLIGAIGYAAYTMLGNRRTLAVLYPGGGYDTFSNVDAALDSALYDGTPVIMEGGKVIHEFTKSRLHGGWLLDGCPLNVVLGYGWLDGQVEALQDAGIQPHCEVVQ